MDQCAHPETAKIHIGIHNGTFSLDVNAGLDFIIINHELAIYVLENIEKL